MTSAPSVDLAAIQAVLLDVDGVLTDGRVGYGGGPDEIKFFDIKDGHGLKLCLRAGLQVGILSGRVSAANQRRAAELGLSFCIQGAKDKLAAFETFLAERHLEGRNCLYVADDLIDLPVMRRAAVAVAVADAVAEVRAAATWVTQAPGGRGAVREVCEWLLKRQNKWNALVERYDR
ncbi:MAG: phenylphosphate carboxylase subunit delta [Lentisphaeria bacterium]|jgi:3-deoxy-D-manno-octulosonate 8-phosphate phosphatase (KDO 8-P phosphatase)